MNAGAREPFTSLRGQLPVRHARCQYHRVGVNGAAVVESHRSRRPVDLEGDGLACGDQLGPEFLGLPARSVRELVAGDAVGEAQVVLDAGTLPGLTAGGGALDQHGLESLRGAVDGGGQPGRSAADHDKVVEVLRRHGGQAQRRSEIGVRRIDEGLALLGDDHGQRHTVLACRFEQSLALGLVRAKPGVVQLISG